uniref:Uncharacterized protein n=1 Tax=Oryza sativa subsp. japonica TaxID=39947 RepID=Q67IV2_ORYSJ|nr:hypothetical protein [Oryza sativa Japonica Group]
MSAPCHRPPPPHGRGPPPLRPDLGGRGGREPPWPRRLDPPRRHRPPPCFPRPPPARSGREGPGASGHCSPPAPSDQIWEGGVGSRAASTLLTAAALRRHRPPPPPGAHAVTVPRLAAGPRFAAGCRPPPCPLRPDLEGREGEPAGRPTPSAPSAGGESEGRGEDLEKFQLHVPHIYTTLIFAGADLYFCRWLFGSKRHVRQRK